MNIGEIVAVVLVIIGLVYKVAGFVCKNDHITIRCEAKAA